MNIRRGRVTGRGQHGSWFHGTVGNARFHAKVYAEPSKFGADPANPRRSGWSNVSKLWIKDGETVVYNYDRGFDFAKGDGAKLAAEIIEAFQ